MFDKYIIFKFCADVLKEKKQQYFAFSSLQNANKAENSIYK